MTFTASPDEGRGAVLVPDVHLGVVVHQELDDLAVTPTGRPDEPGH